jgi:hypothetical protein
MARVAAAMLLAWTTPAVAGGPTVIPRVDDLIDAPRTLFGRTKADIEARLGPPVARHRAVLASVRDPTVLRPAEEIRYPGLTLQFATDARLARAVVTAAAYALPHGLAVGTTADRVQDVLGEPQEATSTRLLYLYSDGYPDTVELYVRDGRVSRIEWTYWVE